MKLSFVCLLVLSLFFCTALARPQYRDIDYKLFGDDSDGIAVDAVYEVITDKPPDDPSAKHHHHHHHKKLNKSNRLDRLKRYLHNL